MLAHEPGSTAAAVYEKQASGEAQPRPEASGRAAP